MICTSKSKYSKWFQLGALTLVYVVGELSHFLLGVVTTPMSQELHYGDIGCLTNPELGPQDTPQEEVYCYEGNSSDVCVDLWVSPTSNKSACVWDYSGLGLEYQLLAGPAFVAVFTVAGIGMGFLSDSYNRKVVLCCCLGALVLATTLMGAATHYWQLFLLRMTIGAGESAFTPTASSVLSDLFPQTVRGFALGVFNWGIYLGYGLSYIIGNYVTAANILGMGWRWSYYITGLLGLAVLLVLLLILQEPVRGAMTATDRISRHEGDPSNTNKRTTIEGDHSNTKDWSSTAEDSNNTKDMTSTEVYPSSSMDRTSSEVDLNNPKDRTFSVIPTSSSAVSGSTVETLDHQECEININPNIAVDVTDDVTSSKPSKQVKRKQMMRDVLSAVRTPSLILLCIAASVRHTAGFTWSYNTQVYFQTYYPSFPVGAWISWVSIVGGTIGVTLGGLISDRLVSRLGARARLYVLGASQMLATPFAIGVLYLEPPAALFSLLGAYIFAAMWFGILFAVLLDVVPVTVRSSTLAIFLFVMNNIGGNAPLLVEPLRAAFSFRTALTIMYPGCFFLSSLLFLLTSLLVTEKTTEAVAVQQWSTTGTTCQATETEKFLFLSDKVPINR